MEGMDATQSDAERLDPIDAISELIPDDDDGPQGNPDNQPQQAEAQQQQAAEENQPADDDPNDPVLKLKVDGEERELKQSELIAQAQKYLAGEKRLEEAANLRKQLEPEFQQVQQERQQLKQALEFYIPQLTELLQLNAPDPQLINEDPQEYMRQNYAFQQRMAQLQQAQAAQAALTQREQAEQAQKLQARAAEEQQKLLQALPDWKDQAKAKAEATAIDGYLQKEGFGDDERNGLMDHRMIVVARKAMLYDQLMAQKGAAQQRVKGVPPRVERPGTAANTAPQDEARKAALAKFNKQPSIDTLAELL
ncbi:hypothetical protein K7G19_19835 [Cupriavidus sp. DB3]|uniref:hypothetical protein n=1 Tax=Cupriavidus sp. DB3 TaxID=2873259 RepID=UPI001CF34403|nr:hypothetical protein [Cupriavidus sp. DB3]MCA7085844.1 hypothetical protein [Cupriavidus sp. DB3]